MRESHCWGTQDKHFTHWTWSLTWSNKNTFIIHLFEIAYNEIGAEGGRAIAEALKTNTSLTELNLGLTQQPQQQHFSFSHFQITANNIGSEGCRAIAATLKTNTSLTELNLGLTQHKYQLFSFSHSQITANKIGDEGWRAIAAALEANTSLKKLCLSCEAIKTLSLYIFLKSQGIKLEMMEPEPLLRDSRATLHSLYLIFIWYSNIATSHFFTFESQAISLEMKEPEPLLSHSRQTPRSLNLVLKVIQQQHFSFSHSQITANKIGDEGCRAIAAALEANTSLTQLDLRAT